MGYEKFFQRLRSGDRPHGNRSTTRERIEPFVGVETIGREVLREQVSKEYTDVRELQKAQAAAKLRKLMNTPVYPSSQTARTRSLYLGRSRGGKVLRHPMRGFHNPFFDLQG